MNLYGISAEYQMLLAKDNYSAEDMDRLNNLSISVKEKAVQVAAYILNQHADLQAMEEAIKKMRDRHAKLADKLIYLNDYLKTQLINCDIKEITDHPEFELKIKNNPPKVDVYDQTLIPDAYTVKTELVRIEKRLIKDAIDQGIEVPGARVIQELRLEIK